MVSEMTIGRLADQAGVNVETIRYYQRRGLLAEPPRPANGQPSWPRSPSTSTLTHKSSQGTKIVRSDRLL